MGTLKSASSNNVMLLYRRAMTTTTTRCLILLLLALMTRPGLQAAAATTETRMKTPEDFLVEDLDKVEPAFATFQGNMYAGLLPVVVNNNNRLGGLLGEDNTAKFMFWLFVPHQQTVPNTMVLWLNGGPGCSSILGGALLENSPVNMGSHAAGTCCIDPNDPLQPNPYAWTKATTMLYVEMPTGVGFSNGGTEPQNEFDVGRDMYGFLQSFYQVFPQLLRNQLSIFGESYAGYFVPSIAHRIASENDKHGKAGRITIPLQSIALGNGWMDAASQGPAVIDYAWWHGMIDTYTRDAFKAEWIRCYQDQAEEKPPFHSFTTTDECGIMEAILAASGLDMLPDGKAPNQYDVTTFDPYAIIAEPNSTLTRFMNNPRVKRALHAPSDIEWQPCIPGGGRRRRQRHRERRRRRLEKKEEGTGLLEHDQPESMVPFVAELLDRWNLRVLVYNGDLDMSVNSAGSEMLLNNMQWSGHRAWKVAGRGIWMTSNAVAGYVKKYSNLTFLVVKNSGHLVPINQPLAALDLVERFLRNVPFLDIPLPSFVLSETAVWGETPTTTQPPSSSSSLLQSSQSSADLDLDPCYPCEDARAGMWMRIVDQIVLAVVCFIAGAIAAHSWRRKGYESISSNHTSNHSSGSTTVENGH